METITKQTSSEARLAQLEAEGQNIIETYLKQVIIDANSIVLKNLQNKLKEVRAEQWKIFDKHAPSIGRNMSFPAAA
jgi:mannose/cellobiose epimerase-like protein (N-acyl-D-glucosamine 2-epimerase family)